MYEPIAHAALNRILDRFDAPPPTGEMRNFYTRLGANFYAIYSLFSFLYGKHEHFERELVHLVEVLAEAYRSRDVALRDIDVERERYHEWFLEQSWAGMALYTDGFAGDLDGLRSKLGYLQELGINLVHVMPILQCPRGASDGGYAVSNFRNVDPRVGTLGDLKELAHEMRARYMLLTLDVVLNHASDEHEWAAKARAGDPDYQDYFYMYPDREIPDRFEESMPEIFPESSPGNFTFDETMQKWVMTVFNSYQWDLNYTNPAVFVEMVDVTLFWANQGADIIRMDAVAFLWKKIGTSCQNEREAHLILQLMKDCCQVVAPGVLFIAEAIVAPLEIVKYFGEDAVVAKECEIAYNATFMALLWDAVATHNAQLTNIAVQNIPAKLDNATWLNYVRCHDDIGLGFDDRDAAAAGYDPSAHRKFLVDYFTGVFQGSPARGQPFGTNHKTGDARISGTLASLVGLESALEDGDEDRIDAAIATILQLHSLIMAFGGIPLLYYGDEIGTLNDTSYLDDSHKANDSRWLHRPRIDWDKAEQRRIRGTPEQRIFDGLKHLIDVRRTIPSFADHNNREIIDTGDDHVFAFVRSALDPSQNGVLVVANFDDAPHTFSLPAIPGRRLLGAELITDLCSGERPVSADERVTVPGHGFYWLRI